jgi:hypothetical protein
MDNVLIAKEGYIYTDGETFGYTIHLGVYDSADNWWEITEEEYQALMELEENSIEENTDRATEEDYKEGKYQ